MLASLVAWTFSLLLSYQPADGVLSFTGLKDGIPMRCLTDQTIEPDWFCLPSPFPDELRPMAQPYTPVEAARIYLGEDS